MKCPKCDYLGFETGDRCKNCGYDFSLLAVADRPEPDLLIRPAATDDSPRVTPWLDELDRLFGAPAPEPSAPVLAATERVSIEPFGTAAPAPAPAPAPALVPESVPTHHAAAPVDPELRIAPSFAPDEEPRMPPPSLPGKPALSPQRAAAARTLGPLFSPVSEDEPLVKLPATPRAPLAVRRTPDRPRLRALSKPLSAPEADPMLQFAEVEVRTPEPEPRRPPRAEMTLDGNLSGAGPRFVAALIDHAILAGIDLAVVYFSLRLASLTLADWRALPPLPMLAFLAIVKVAYFSAFTAVGGQTIGKMAVGIRVVTDDRTLVDPARAMRRTLAGVVSFVTLGLAFVPALFAADKRALHDRLAHTRVVVLPSGQF
jgi:uncharacterized RDD family membrane protein YckC